MFKKFMTEFKEFAQRGSAIDMAVGIIVGSAMTTVVNSLVKDIIMPPIGIILGNVDFSAYKIHLVGDSALNIGLFANSIVSFLLTMFAVFIFVRVVNKMRSKTITTRNCPYCCTSVNVAATKCPNCCSALKAEKPKVQEAEISFKKIVPIDKITKSVKKIIK